MQYKKEYWIDANAEPPVCLPAEVAEVARIGGMLTPVNQPGAKWQAYKDETGKIIHDGAVYYENMMRELDEARGDAG